MYACPAKASRVSVGNIVRPAVFLLTAACLSSVQPPAPSSFLASDVLPTLAPRNDLAMLTARFREHGRVVIPDVLGGTFADDLYQCLNGWQQWALVTVVAGVHRNFDSAKMDSLEPAKRAELDELICVEARSGFQYIYDRYPLADPGHRPSLDNPLLLRAHDMLNSQPFLDRVREVTGINRIRFADGQMTRYRRGNYLTLHNDYDEGKNRLAAYVLSLTRDWLPDYGGQLQFIGDDGRVAEALVPGFNTLTLFKVPTQHLVTQVAQHVQVSRLSITGWLRY